MCICKKIKITIIQLLAIWNSFSLYLSQLARSMIVSTKHYHNITNKYFYFYLLYALLLRLYCLIILTHLFLPLGVCIFGPDLQQLYVLFCSTKEGSVQNNIKLIQPSSSKMCARYPIKYITLPDVSNLLQHRGTFFQIQLCTEQYNFKFDSGNKSVFDSLDWKLMSILYRIQFPISLQFVWTLRKLKHTAANIFL